MCSINALSPEVHETINTIAKHEDFFTYIVNIERIKLTGSYLGELYDVNMQGETKHGPKDLYIFLKLKNQTEDYIPFLSMNDLYRTETFAYNELSEIFREMQRNAVIPLNERFKMVKCYGTNTDAVMLENIVKHGYQTVNRMDVVSLQYAEMSVSELAKLHALSFALAETRPNYFNEKIKPLKYPVIFGDKWNAFLKSMVDSTMQNVDDIADKVKSNCYAIADNYAKYLEEETTNRCICHGDYKLGNIMAKMNNEEMVNVIPLDYQFLYYGCPVMDFINFIYTATDKQFRDAHLSHLKDVYHGTLGKFLGYFNMDVERVYPRKMFEDDYKVKLPYGLLVGFVTLPAVLVPEEGFDATQELCGQSFQTTNVVLNRQREMIKEFIEWGYI